MIYIFKIVNRGDIENIFFFIVLMAHGATQQSLDVHSSDDILVKCRLCASNADTSSCKEVFSQQLTLFFVWNKYLLCVSNTKITSFFQYNTDYSNIKLSNIKVLFSSTHSVSDGRSSSYMT